MAIELDIRKALRGRLLTVPGLPAARSWENRDFSAVKGTPWVEESFYPVVNDLVTNGYIEVSGFAQFSLRFPRNADVVDADTIARAVLDHFPPGYSLGGFASVTKARRTAGMIEDQWYHVPVTVNWYGQVARPAIL